MKLDISNFLQAAVKRLGGWYLMSSVLGVQFLAFISTGVALYLIQNNAQFTREQIGTVTGLATVLVIVGNVVMAVWASRTSQNAVERLDDWARGRPFLADNKQEVAAWREVNSLPLRFILTTFLVAMVGHTSMSLWCRPTTVWACLASCIWRSWAVPTMPVRAIRVFWIS